MTRERMSDTITQLEQKLNLVEVVREHPWPSLAAAVGAGFLLAGSKADVKAAAATVKATGGASNRLGELLDVAAASAITALSAALQDQIDNVVGELKGAIGATTNGSARQAATTTGNGPVAADATMTGATVRDRGLEQPM